MFVFTGFEEKRNGLYLFVCSISAGSRDQSIYLNEFECVMAPKIVMNAESF